ncbi:MAG: hypothetical protein EXS10_03885 [Phycisphaerales bacterium]|nr:hypothetical protein [Phycisphaerales bacterium]
MNLATHSLLVAAMLSWSSGAFAQHSGQAVQRSKANQRAFANLADMFSDFDGWHGPVTNLALQPQISWTRDTLANSNVVTGSLAVTSYTWITPTLTTVIDLSIDQVADPQYGETLVFSGEGFGIDDAYVLWSDQRVGLQAGMFTVPFGFDWGTLPGLFDTTFVSDYQFDNRVGGIASLSTANDGCGIHGLQAGAFCVDGSFMSQTAWTRSGPANDGDPQPGDDGASWFVSYTATEIPLLAPSLSYQFSYISQSAPTSGLTNEKGFSGGFSWTIPLDGSVEATVESEWLSVTPSFEYVNFWDWQGVEGANADYLTPAIAINYGDWEVDFAATWRNSDDGTDASDDVLLSATLTYNFFWPQSQIQFGYAYQDTDDGIDHMIGMQINMPINVISYGLLGR